MSTILEKPRKELIQTEIQPKILEEPKPKVYLSYSLWDRHTQRIQAIKQKLEQQGYEVIDPYETVQFNKAAPIIEEIMRKCFPVIRKCSKLIAVKTLSPGVELELNYADTEGLSVQTVYNEKDL